MIITFSFSFKLDSRFRIHITSGCSFTFTVGVINLKLCSRGMINSFLPFYSVFFYRSPTMTKGSKSSKSSASKTVATVGYISTVPGKTTVTFKGGKGGGEGSYMNKSRVSFGGKQTGCYGRAITKEKASAGEFQWKNGTSGTKSEYKKSSTLRIGDQSGYTEVYSEQRVRNVSYNKSSGSKNFIAYDNGDGGEYGWYDCY